MKAIGVNKFGGPEALEVVALPEPQVRRGHVRIRVHAATVNPGDIALRNGFRAMVMEALNPPPYVPGWDAGGVLEEIGDGVSTDLEVGDDVMAIVQPIGSNGAYSEQVIVPAKSVARTPAGSTYAEAATIPLNGLSARLALDLLDLRAGDRLAVTGAAGAVGGYAVQIAKAEGLKVIVDAAERDEQLMRELGADIVVPRGPDFAAKVREAVPDGVAGLVDAAALNEQVVPAVHDGGRIATLRGFQDKGERGITYHPVWVPNYARDPGRLDSLRKLVESGALTVRIAETMPAEKAADAHRTLEAGGVRGRLILEF
jgi:NADPH:quinone reductase-like Zn-dependent oxidoreductase